MKQILFRIAPYLGSALIILAFGIGLLARHWEPKGSSIERQHRTRATRPDWNRLLEGIGDLRIIGQKLQGQELRGERQWEIEFKELSYIKRERVVTLTEPSCKVTSAGQVVARFNSNSVRVIPHRHLLEFIGNVKLVSTLHHAWLSARKIKWWWTKGRIQAIGDVRLATHWGHSTAHTARGDTVLGSIALSGAPILVMRLRKWLYP